MSRRSKTVSRYLNLKFQPDSASKTPFQAGALSEIRCLQYFSVRPPARILTSLASRFVTKASSFEACRRSCLQTPGP